MSGMRSSCGGVWLLAGLMCGSAAAAAAQPSRVAADAAAGRVDAHTARVRLVVLTDIANEPDDQMSLVRLLVYANHFDIEGLVATTSTWLRTGVRPDVLHTVLDAYAAVQPNLLRHAPGFPAASELKRLVAAGQPGYGMASTGAGSSSPGATLLLAAMRRDDPRPLWVTAWGGANTLAQALIDARARLTPEQLNALVARLRVYAISDQDDAGAWLRREFPSLHYIGTPSTQDGQEYAGATWTGISGDRFYRNAPGADFATFTDAWLDANIRARAPLGAHYPYPCCIHEGDTPSFLGLIDNGLGSAMNASFGGWGGRYAWRRPHGEPRPFWTQGGDAYPGRPSSRDTVRGLDGQLYTSDQATVWRWRQAFQHDFAARMAWTVLPPEAANHNPQVVVNGSTGTAPLLIAARVGVAVTLDAAGTRDPDGQPLTFRWWFYPEAGSGMPSPVAAPAPAPAQHASTAPNASPPAARGDREAPLVRLEGEATAQATVVPQLPGVAHVIVEVTDGGTPRLTSYRRVILTITP